MNKKPNKRRFTRLWLIQVALTLVVAAGSALLYGSNGALSAVLGGLVCIIPNAFFANRLFKYEGARAAKQIVNSFYKGEALKFVLTIILFSVVFVVCSITPVVFFISYIVILMSHWFAPWVIVNKQNRPESD